MSGVAGVFVVIFLECCCFCNLLDFNRTLYCGSIIIKARKILLVIIAMT